MKEVTVRISDSLREAAEAWGRGHGLNLDQVIAQALSEFTALQVLVFSAEDLRCASIATQADAMEALAELERMEDEVCFEDDGFNRPA